ncbi:MAG: cysteine desulfurase family protein [Candidatus Hadarchaeia archaeon]
MQVYLDNGNTTPVDERVLDEMEPFYIDKFGHPLFIYQRGREANEAVEESRQIIADTIAADEKDLIFTSGATEANDIALRGVAKARKKDGDHIIVSKVENPGILRIAEKLEEEFDVDYLDVDEKGFVNLDELSDLIREDTILVSIAHVCGEIGTIQPMQEIGSIIAEENSDAYFHSNLVNSYGFVPVEFEKFNLDLATFDAHRIHGPKGVGALVKSLDVEIEPVNFGYLSLSNLRPGIENVPGIIGLRKAAELAFNDFEEKVDKIKSLRDMLIEGIENRVDDVVLHGPIGEARSPANVNFSFKNVEGESVMMQLDMRGISVATGSACATRKLEPSHVLTAIGVESVVAHGAIRFTLSRMNTEEEINYVLGEVTEVVEGLRKISPMGREGD